MNDVFEILEVEELWEYKLKQFLKHDSLNIRSELLRGLQQVIEYQRDDVTELVQNNFTFNVDLKENNEQYELFTNLHYNKLIGQLYSATYLSNANYYNHAIDFENDETKLSLPFKTVSGGAEYNSRGSKKHLVKIPRKRFVSISDLFHAFDAESRHAVHNNILHTKNFPIEKRANRAYTVITEVIDRGEVFKGNIEKTPHYDPFINEMFFVNNETNGHNGAKYICKHVLDENRIKKRYQLNWLARVKFADKEPENENVKLIKKMFVDLTVMASSRSNTPYNNDLSLLNNFYSGKEYGLDEAHRLIWSLRKFLVEKMPYEPKNKGFVKMKNGKVLTKFATSLDYVVLKLENTVPSDLIKEINL